MTTFNDLLLISQVLKIVCEDSILSGIFFQTNLSFTFLELPEVGALKLAPVTEKQPKGLWHVA